MQEIKIDQCSDVKGLTCKYWHVYTTGKHVYFIFTGDAYLFVFLCRSTNERMQKVIKPLNDLFYMNYKKNSQRHTNIISHVLRFQLKFGES